MRSNKRVGVGALFLGGLCVLAACGGTLEYAPHGTARAPEADGHLTAHVDSGQSATHVHLRVEHLAAPERIVPGSTAYVVWERHDQAGQWMRVGTLDYHPDSRTGELETTAPETAFELNITAENMPNPGSPSPNVILAQRVGGH